MGQLEQNGVATRFSGLLNDFFPGQRCHAAGVSSYHRATMPGTALVISIDGLLFHACKLVYYIGAILSFGLASRLWLVASGLGLMVAAPQRIDSDLLDQPSANLLIHAFKTNQGYYFAASPRWLIRAEVLLYPFGRTLSHDFLLPMGVNFSREVSDPVADARSEQIAKVCSSILQISQSAEYETLRSFMTNRAFCDSR